MPNLYNAQFLYTGINMVLMQKILFSYAIETFHDIKNAAFYIYITFTLTQDQVKILMHIKYMFTIQIPLN